MLELVRKLKTIFIPLFFLIIALTIIYNISSIFGTNILYKITPEIEKDKLVEETNIDGENTADNQSEIFDAKENIAEKEAIDHWQPIDNQLNIFDAEENFFEKYVIDSWQPVGDPSRLFGVYSAYYDERLEMLEHYKCPHDHMCYGTVRIVAILPRNTSKSKFHCHYKYSDGFVKTNVKASKIQNINYWCPIHYNPVCAYMITCALIQYVHDIGGLHPPEAVGITYENEVSMVNPTVFTYIRYPSVLNPNVEPRDKINEIALCTPNFHGGYDNALRVAEYIELNKLLGMTKFYFYNNSVSAEVTQLLNYYVENENVEVFDWKVKDYVAKIFSNAVYACVADCYYRASFVDNYKYVLLHDIDEFIIPLMDDVTTLPELIKKLDTDERFSSFNVQHTFVNTKFAHVDKNSKNFTNKYLYTQNNVERALPKPRHTNSKMIGKGKYMNLPGIHWITSPTQNTIERFVEPYEALMFHYREEQEKSNKYPIIETAVLKYKNELRKKVDDVCRKVFVDGICPSKVVAQKIKNRKRTLTITTKILGEKT